MGININDLSPLGASLLSDNESFLGNIRDLSAEELKISGGGGYSGGYGSGSGSGSSKSKSKSKSGSGSCGCGNHC
jgi:hypothetical protein